MCLGISEDEVSVSLAAPPREGQANKELVEFMASALDLRKAEVDFDKGAKSRSKTVVINTRRFGIDEIRRKIEEQIGS
jgi:uncharacterized protein (TIGR00251 family)